MSGQVLLRCAMLAVALAAPTAADLASGQSAFDRGDFAGALREWMPLAKAGDAEAQYRVGRLYYYGQGVEVDMASAARWYRQAAEAGHARAQTNLGVLYERGQGLPQDDAQAAHWYRLAADRGRAVAQRNLGRLYEAGRGVPRDDAEAARLYEKAALQGDGEAQLALAALLEEGRGVSQDTKQAQHWRSMAGEGESTVPAGDAPTPEKAADVPPSQPIDTGVGLAKAEDAYRRGDYAGALETWLELAQDGNAEAALRAGVLYQTGRGTPTNVAEAGRLYDEAARKGQGEAMYRLAFLYLRGKGITHRQDWPRAHAWFALAAERGIGDAANWCTKLAKKMSPEELEEARSLAAGWRVAPSG